jgi:hypothetical protein
MKPLFSLKDQKPFQCPRAVLEKVENIPGTVEKVPEDERDGKLRVLAPGTKTVGVETFSSG